VVQEIQKVAAAAGVGAVSEATMIADITSLNDAAPSRGPIGNGDYLGKEL
jgi:hypothetical protein